MLTNIQHYKIKKDKKGCQTSSQKEEFDKKYQKFQKQHLNKKIKRN